jgi:hypothetical protein
MSEALLRDPAWFVITNELLLTCLSFSLTPSLHKTGDALQVLNCVCVCFLSLYSYIHSTQQFSEKIIFFLIVEQECLKAELIDLQNKLQHLLVVGSKTNTWKDCLILWLIRACVCLTLIL